MASCQAATLTKDVQFTEPGQLLKTAEIRFRAFSWCLGPKPSQRLPEVFFMSPLEYARRARLLFLAAGWWNVLVGAAGLVGPRATAQLLYGDGMWTDERLLWFAWSDFSACVLLFGVGYFIVAGDVRKNHGIVLLGVLGKAGVVVSFPLRYLAGAATVWLLVPAVVDGLLAILFLLFLATRSRLDV